MRWKGSSFRKRKTTNPNNIKEYTEKYIFLHQKSKTRKKILNMIYIILIDELDIAQIYRHPKVNNIVFNIKK